MNNMKKESEQSKEPETDLMRAERIYKEWSDDINSIFKLMFTGEESKEFIAEMLKLDRPKKQKKSSRKARGKKSS